MRVAVCLMCVLSLPYSLSASTLSVSSGSSLGSLASSRGSLNTSSSRGSLNSLSSGDLYYTPAEPPSPLDLDYQCKLDLLLQEPLTPSGITYRRGDPPGTITTIHEHEVENPHPHNTSLHTHAVGTGTTDLVPLAPLVAVSSKPAEPSKSVTSLSSRSSLSSLSPPGSPLVLEGVGAFPSAGPQDFGDGDVGLVVSDFGGLSLGFYDGQGMGMFEPETGERDRGEAGREGRGALATLRESITGETFAMFKFFLSFFFCEQCFFIGSQGQYNHTNKVLHFPHPFYNSNIPLADPPNPQPWTTHNIYENIYKYIYIEKQVIKLK